MTFQGLFLNKSRTFSINKNLNALHSFSKQTLLFGFTEVTNPDNEKQPMTGHFEQKSGLVELRFCFTALLYQKYFN